MKKKYLLTAVIASSALIAIIVPTLLYFTSTPAWILVERIDSNDTVFQNSAVALTDETLANYPKLEEGIAFADQQYKMERRRQGSTAVMMSNSEGNELVSLLGGNASSLPSIYPSADSKRFIVSDDGKQYSVLIEFQYNQPLTA